MAAVHAVIQKWSLTLIFRATVAGNLLCILNDKRRFARVAMLKIIRKASSRKNSARPIRKRL
jgi:hypothetical protein